MRSIVHEVADGTEVALGGEAPLREDEHAGAEALDLVEHVARHHDGAALGAQSLEQRR